MLHVPDAACDAPDHVPDAVPDANPLEELDVAVAKAVAPIHRSDAMKIVGWVSDIGDQPPMRVVCGAAIVAGLAFRRPRLARAGVRALLAHTVATWAKSFIKHRVDRTRPRAFLKEGRYKWEPGHTHESTMNSFPSGHTAGIVAVAHAFARDLPAARGPALLTAGFVAAAQVPRCMHYPTDIAAGAVVGWASEWATSRVFDRLLPRAPRPIARLLAA